ncbi:hypothetical protein AaE_000750, partial [Aphanomyces astaci]
MSNDPSRWSTRRCRRQCAATPRPQTLVNAPTASSSGSAVSSAAKSRSLRPPWTYTPSSTALKFERYCSLDGSLANFDKLRKAVEKRESTTLSDSHLASVLLSALPDCIAHDVQVWRGARPSIPYTQLRELSPQHWHELTQKHPDFLGPKPTAHAVPLHGSGQAPETTRSSALRLSSYDGYGQTTGLSPWRSQRDMPREDRGYCDYCAHADHRTIDCTKLSRAFHQNAVRRDFVFPPGWVAIPPGQLPPHGGGRRNQHGQCSGHSHPDKRPTNRPRGGRGGGCGGRSAHHHVDVGALLNALQQGLAHGGQNRGGYAHGGRSQRGYDHGGYSNRGYAQDSQQRVASSDRRDQRDQSPFRHHGDRNHS